MNINSEEYLDKGELLCVIIPEDHIFYGVAEVSIGDFHKVREDNKIIMSFSEGKMVNGMVERIYPLSGNQHSYKVMIKFEGNVLHDKQVGTIHIGKISLNDVSMLKKFASSIGVRI